jgi:RND superfamily putative drug exporter
MRDKLIDEMVRRPVRLLAIAAAITIFAGVLGGPVQNLLVPSRADFGDPTAESGHVEASLKSVLSTGVPGGVVALVRTHGDIRRDRSSQRAVARAATRLEDDPAIASVTSPDEQRGMISRGGHSAYLVATLKAMPDAGIQDALEHLETVFRAQPNVVLGGTEFAYHEAGEQSRRDLVDTELLVFPILLLVALFVFRGVVAALLPLVVGAVAIAVTLAAMRLINGAIPLSNFSLNLVTSLALALGIDYSLFIVSRFREELADGQTVEASLRRTMSTAGRTVAISSLTVGAALASLLVFPQRFLYSMGIGGVLVTLSAAGVSLTVLPALLGKLGHRIDALSIRRSGRGRATAPRDAGFWYRLGSAVMRRPGPVALATTVVLVGLALPALRMHFIPFSASMLPSGTGTRQVDDALREDFKTSGSLHVVTVSAAPGATQGVGGLAAAIGRLPGAAHVSAPRYAGQNLWTINVLGRGADDTPAAQRLVSDIRALGGYPSRQVGGETATSVDKLNSLGSHLPLAIALIATTTFLLMFVLTGSVVLPVKGLLMNVLTIGGAFGILVLIFQDGHLSDTLGFTPQHGLEATQPVLLFALAFGLSTDYGIFLLARVTEAHEDGMPTKAAVVYALQRTGPIITAAALLFCVAIGALAASPLVVLKLFAIGTTVAVILDATLARGLLVPALIGLLGRWNWWAPRTMRNLHRKLGLSEAPPKDGGPGERERLPEVRQPNPTYEEPGMKRIALFTAECAQVGPALGAFIEREQDRIELVVASDVYRGRPSNMIRQVLTNFRRSGFRFVMYLTYSFIFYFAYARLDRLRAALTGTPRKCLTIAEECERLGIPYVKTADINGPEVAARLEAARLDGIVIYWFDQIIHDRMISIPRKGVINVHAAFLPQCRGLFPVLYSATKNDGIYGITAHEIEDAQIDAGPILAQTLVEVPSDRSIIYRDAVVNCGGVGMLSEALADFDSYHQKRRYTDGGSYFSYPTRADMREARRAGIRLATFRDFVAACHIWQLARAGSKIAGDRRRIIRASTQNGSATGGWHERNSTPNGDREAGTRKPQALTRA